MLRRLKLRVSFPAASCGEPAAPQWWNWLQIGWFALEEITIALYPVFSVMFFFPPPPALLFCWVKSQEGAAMLPQQPLDDGKPHSNHTLLFLLLCFAFYFFCKDKRWRRFRSRTLQVLWGKSSESGKKWWNFSLGALNLINSWQNPFGYQSIIFFSPPNLFYQQVWLSKYAGSAKTVANINPY